VECRPGGVERLNSASLILRVGFAENEGFGVTKCIKEQGGVNMHALSSSKTGVYGREG
jgi:hypothetical protein